MQNGIVSYEISDNKAKIFFNNRNTKLDLDVVLILDKITHDFFDKNIRDIEFDFSEISFITSLALGKLVRYQKDFMSIDGKISIINTTQNVYKVFEDTKLNEILSVRKI